MIQNAMILTVSICDACLLLYGDLFLEQLQQGA